MDTSCPHCNEEAETIIRIFLSVSRAIWFGIYWGFHYDDLLISNHEELFNLVIEPPILNLPHLKRNV